ncbi:MAG: RDD family protein [Gammaproteobacteria bacterium]
MQSPRPESANTPEPAGLARRLGAMLYDSLLLFAVSWAVTAVVIGLRVLGSGEQAVRGAGGPAASGLLLQLPLLVALAGFFVWFWTRSGQTLGMQSWRLRVETEDGARLDWRTALLRLLLALLSAICLGAGYWWILLDAQKRSWHDRWTRTRVVLLPR